MHTRIAVVSAALGCLLLSQMSAAEIVLTDTPDVAISGQIEIPAAYGKLVGTNLFHSFLRFNVQEGESATFTGPSGIDNVLARVTGTSSSFINGPLRSEIVGANLFLLNPNGVLFGEGSVIDVDGSLYVSGAASIVFEDGSQWFAAESGQSTLTSAPPSAFGFTNGSSGPVAFDGAALSKPGGSHLAISGTGISVKNASLYLPDGTIDLVAVQDTVAVPIDPVDRLLSPDVQRGPIEVFNEGDPFPKLTKMLQQYGEVVADIDVSGESGGMITVNADSLNMSGAYVFADTQGSGTGRGIEIDLASSLTVDGAGRITADSLGDGDAGTISVNVGGQVALRSSSVIASDTKGLGAMGNGGSISILADELLVESLAQVKSTTNSLGNGGRIEVSARAISLLTGGTIAGQTISAGTGASVTVSASEEIVIDGRNDQFNVASGMSVSTLGEGDGGSIDVTTRHLSISGGGGIRAFSGGQTEVAGAAGSITIDADEIQIGADSSIDVRSFSTAAAGSVTIDVADLSLDGQDALIASATIGSGDGGSVEIASDNIELNDGALISVSTSATGAAGAIALTAGTIALNAASVEASTSGAGAGGGIAIDADSLELHEGALVDSSTTAAGDAGNIELGASLVELFSASSIRALSGGQDEVAGAAGGIAIAGDTLFVGEGSSIDVQSHSTAAAGTIGIYSSDLVLEGEDARVASATTGSGAGGNVVVVSQSVQVRDQGTLTVSASASGDAGQLEVTAGPVTLVGGNISASTSADGAGGEISIAASSLDLDEAASIDSSTTGAGNAGGIWINAPLFDLVNGSSIRAFSGGTGEIAGAAGSIAIDTGDFRIDNGSSIDVESYSRASAGSIQIASDRLYVAGEGTAITSSTRGSGAGGSVQVTSNKVELDAGGTITASTSGAGDAGDIELSALEVAIADASIRASTTAPGQGGTIHLIANALDLTDEALVDTSTTGSGPAGSILLEVAGTLAVVGQGTGVISQSGDGTDGAFGPGGDIAVVTDALRVHDHGKISALATGEGFAGDLALTAATSLHLESGAAILTSSLNSGGGNIDVTVDDTILLEDSILVASAGGQNIGDDSGNITIDPTYLILKNSQLLAQADYGDGGAIFLTVQNFISDVRSVMDASSNRGNNGQINIEAPDNSVAEAVGSVPVRFSSMDSILLPPCSAAATGRQTSLVLTPPAVEVRSLDGYDLSEPSEATLAALCRPK